MAVVTKRFNAKMAYHWQRIIEFLKLHYSVSRRSDSPYWLDNRAPASCPEALAEKLILWRQQPPWHDDAPLLDELFPSASYQYVLYGMGFKPCHLDAGTGCEVTRKSAERLFRKTQQQTERMLRLLPANRQLLRSVANGMEIWPTSHC